MNSNINSVRSQTGCWNTFCAWVSPLFSKIANLFKRIFCCSQPSNNQREAQSLQGRVTLENGSSQGSTNNYLPLPLRPGQTAANNNSNSQCIQNNASQTGHFSIKEEQEVDLSGDDNSQTFGQAAPSNRIDLNNNNRLVDLINNHNPNDEADLRGDSQEPVDNNNYLLEERIAALKLSCSDLSKDTQRLSPLSIDACLQIIYSDPRMITNATQFNPRMQLPKSEEEAEEQEKGFSPEYRGVNWYKWTGLDRDKQNKNMTFASISDVGRDHWFCCIADHHKKKKKVYVFDSLGCWEDRVQAVQMRATKMNYQLVVVNPHNNIYSKFQSDDYSCGLWCVLFADFYKQKGLNQDLADNQVLEKFTAFYQSKKEQPGYLANYRKEMLQKVQQEIETAQKILKEEETTEKETIFDLRN